MERQAAVLHAPMKGLPTMSVFSLCDVAAAQDACGAPPAYRTRS